MTGGDIRIDGASVVSLPAQQRNIGVAFEHYALYPPLTVAENLGFGLAARRRCGRAEIARRVAAMADRIGLAELLDASRRDTTRRELKRIQRDLGYTTVLAAGRSVVLGIRPEDLRLAEDGSDGVRATVSAYEPLLETGIATPALDRVDRPLVVQTGPEVRLERDQAVRVSADPHHTHVFDAETEKALR